MGKVKTNGKIQLKACTNCFAPTYIKFNFSFITYDDNFEDKYQLQFLKRVRTFSEVTYLELLSWDKKRGLEFEKVDITKEISPLFFSNHRNFNDGKYAIFRLYPNDNPIQARIIGKVIKNVFYIFYIDIGGKLYSH